MKFPQVKTGLNNKYYVASYMWNDRTNETFNNSIRASGWLLYITTYRINLHIMFRPLRYF